MPFLPPRQHGQFCSLGLPATAGCSIFWGFLVDRAKAFQLHHCGAKKVCLIILKTLVSTPSIKEAQPLGRLMVPIMMFISNTRIEILFSLLQNAFSLYGVWVNLHMVCYTIIFLTESVCVLGADISACFKPEWCLRVEIFGRGVKSHCWILVVKLNLVCE